VYYATIFLDAVISEFLEKAKHIQGIEDPIRFAEKSRALGLGALGWASLLQKMRIPFIGIQATSLTRVIFSHMKEKSDKASMWMADEFGEPTWCKGSGYRNLTCIAVAPNRSSSKLAGGVSQGIEPFAANLYMDDDAKGAHLRRNPDLETLLDEKGLNTPQTWDIIAEDKGSVKNIDGLTEDEKEIFRTFKEINQLELVRQAAVRQEYIDQGQSLNLAFFHDAPAKWINQVHIEAWKLGIKALYYLRSESNLRADSKQQRDLYSECIVCEG
jgi:ribonucleoside-diphosphate reductase alpha chain